MKKLLKLHGLNSDMQYFELIVNHFKDGQKQEAFKMFSAMPRIERKSFVQAAITNWQSGLNNQTLSLLIELI